jgi:hypothetical protein
MEEQEMRHASRYMICGVGILPILTTNRRVLISLTWVKAFLAGVGQTERKSATVAITGGM